jgi:hypothetical protein
MKAKIAVAFVFALILAWMVQPFGHSHAQTTQGSATAPANAWKGLVPLRSTRADVEKMLGAPTEVTGRAYAYKLKTENVAFTYAKGNCSGSDNGWNLPAGTILEIDVTPQTTLLASEAGLDLSKFWKANTDDADLSMFTNADIGVTVRTKGNANVVNIKYGAASSDAAKACP